MREGPVGIGAWLTWLTAHVAHGSRLHPDPRTRTDPLRCAAAPLSWIFDRVIPPARATDAEVDFSGVAGGAMKHGAVFLASLTNDGPLKVGRSHWLASALAKYMGPVVPPATKRNTSMRLIVYVFLPAFIFDAALDDLPLPFWPLLARGAKLLRALLDAGMPSAPRRAQQLVLTYAAKLSGSDRALKSTEVVEAVRPPIPGWTPRRRCCCGPVAQTTRWWRSSGCCWRRRLYSSVTSRLRRAPVAALSRGPFRLERVQRSEGWLPLRRRLYSSATSRLRRAAVAALSREPMRLESVQ